MRRLLVPLVALVTLAVSVPSAGAIELRNEDAQPYTVRVTSRTMSRNIHLPAHSASIVVCVKSCHFRLRGGGQVRASGDDVVSITRKKLVRRPVVKAPL